MIITQPSHPFNLKLILENKNKKVLENSLAVHGKAVGNCWSDYFHLLPSFKYKELR